MARKSVMLLGVGCVALAAASCSFKNGRGNGGRQGESATIFSADLLVQEKFQLNFAPNPDQPLYIQFVIANTPKRDAKWVVRTLRPDGTEVKDVFGTPNEDIVSKPGGLFDRSVSLPMLVGPKTVGGLIIEISVPELRGKDGKPLLKRSEFSLMEGAYSAAHQAKGSEFEGYAVVNEFLEPEAVKSAANLGEYLEALLAGGGVADAKAGRDLSIIRDGKSLDVKRDESGRISVSLSRDTAFSWGKSYGPMDIYTNGYRVLLGGDDASEVRIFVGMRPEVRRKSEGSPEVRVFTLRAPEILPQLKRDEPHANPAGYSASRGERGETATTGDRCDTLLRDAAGRMNDFVMERRGSCGSNFANLQGINQTLVLRKLRTAKTVSVLPRNDMSVRSLTNLVNLGPSEQPLQFFRVDVDDEGEGQRCGQRLDGTAKVSCVLPQYEPELFSFENGQYIATKRFLEDYIARAPDPVVPGVYPGAKQVMVLAHNPEVNEGASAGSVLGVRGVKSGTGADGHGTKFLPEESAYFGRASDWERGGMAWHWAQAQCAQELNGYLKAGATLPGASVGGKDVQRSARAQFSAGTPNIYAIDSLDFSVTQADAEVNFLPVSDDQLRNPGSPYKCTDNLASLRDNACVTGDDFQLSPAARADIRPLSNEATILGRPGRDGYPSPVMEIALGSGFEWTKLDRANESLTGEAGPEGYSLKGKLSPGQFMVRVENERGEVINDLLKPSPENPQFVEFHRTQVALVAGTAVRAKYVVNGVDGRYEAAYSDHSEAKGKFIKNVSLEMQPTFSIDNNPVSVGANFGGVRTGKNTQFADPLGGFWNLRKGKVPKFLRGFDGDGEGEDGGFDMGGVDHGGSDERASSDDSSGPACALFQSPRVVESIGEIDCGALFPGGFDGLRPSGSWKALFPVQSFITSGNFPECMTRGGCASVPRQADMSAVNRIESDPFDCVGYTIPRFIEPWADYHSRMGTACMATDAFRAKIDERNKNNAAQLFASECTVRDVCNLGGNAIRNFGNSYPLSGLELAINRVRAQRATSMSAVRSELAQESVLERKSLDDIRRDVGKLREAIGTAASPGIISSLLESKKAEWSYGIRALLNGREVPSGFGSLEEARQTMDRYEQLLADAERVLAPRIVRLACSYALTGTFRLFERAEPVAATFYPRKTRNSPDLEAKLASSFQYDDGLVQRRILKPDTTPIVSNLVLKEVSTAKPGKLTKPLTDTLLDCADVGNRMLRLRLPLPRSMFAKCQFGSGKLTEK